MNNLRKGMSEWVLGTESRKFYRQQRNFYREFIENKSQQNMALAGSVAAEALELTIGKALPNVLSAVSLANIALTGDAPYLKLLPASEGPRLFSHFFSGYKKLINVERYLIAEDNREMEFTKQIYDLCDQDTRGEEWKDN